MGSTMGASGHDAFIVGFFDSLDGSPTRGLIHWDGSLWNSLSAAHPGGYGGICVSKDRFVLNLEGEEGWGYSNEVALWDGESLRTIYEHRGTYDHSSDLRSNTNITAFSIYEGGAVIGGKFVGLGNNVPSYALGIYTFPPSAVANPPSAPRSELLLTCSPNPAAQSTSIRFTLPHTSRASLQVTDPLGRIVATPLDARLDAGEHVVQWDGAGLPNGAYVVRLATDRETAMTEVMIVR
jgi:hypothetical protein